MKPGDAFRLLRDVVHEWSEDKVPRLGAALAYYSIFSLAPLVVIAIGIAGLVFEEQAAREGIAREIQDTVGEPAAAAIEAMVAHTSQTGSSWLATVTGLAILLFGASGVFVQLQDALNTIWKVTPKPGRTLWNIFRERVLSFAMVLGTGCLLLASLVISAALAALGKFLESAGRPGGVWLWEGVDGVVSFSLLTLLFALLFKFMPDVKIAWRDVGVGAAVTALFFTLGKYLIGLYLGQNSTTSAFGAAGSLVVILLWVYYSSQIVLFGAEFTRVSADRYGSRVVPAENAVAVTQADRDRQGMPRRADVEAATRQVSGVPG